MKYKVKNVGGISVTVDDSLEVARSVYCLGRACCDCRLSSGNQGNVYASECSLCNDDELLRRFGGELLRRFGGEIEIIHDEKTDETKTPAQNDPVNHPSHYTQGGIECIDAITAALACHTDSVSAWLTGQVLKYLWRWPLKARVEDLKKAKWYLERLIEREEKR